jgi:hypothetical protein
MLKIDGETGVLTVSIVLFMLASAGVMAMGLKFIRATPLIDYHAEITMNEEIGNETRRVFGALYKVLGGAFLALGAVLAVITVFGVGNDLLWAKLASLLGALIAGGASAVVPREVERATGVRTPWRIAAALALLTLVAFILSIL